MGVFLWAPFLLYLGLTVYLSHQPNVPGASLAPDYVFHGLEFAILTGLLLRSLSGRFLAAHSRGARAGALLFGCGYGLIDELHQSFVPGRDSSLKDAAVDAASTTLIVLSAGWFARRPGRRPADARSPHIVMLTRDGCHLCEVARKILGEVLGELGLQWEEIDIDSDPGLSARFGQQIPVVLVDGVKRFKGRVDRQRLARLVRDRSRLRAGADASSGSPAKPSGAGSPTR